MIVNVPTNGPSHIYGRDGKAYMSKVMDGRLVVDIPGDLFHSLLRGRDGKAWDDANVGGDVWKYLTPGAHY